VDSDGSRLFFGYLKKLLQDLFGRACSVCKVQVVMSDALLLELVSVVSLIIEPNDSGDS
jgi:hypothetical protein